jgi:hypothetical protein
MRQPRAGGYSSGSPVRTTRSPLDDQITRNVVGETRLESLRSRHIAGVDAEGRSR